MRQSGSLGSLVLATVLLLPSFALAQTPSPSQPKTPPANPPASSEERPETTTFMGDTGLWTVPVAEVLPNKRWSFSAYRQQFNDNQGFSNVSMFPVDFGVGVGGHAEIFASVIAVTRVDRDIRPVFVSSIPKAGGVVPQNPLMADVWSGSQFGDVWVGLKYNLMSEYDQKAAAFAIRPMIKIPTASASKGAGTGKVDFAVDAVLSKELMAHTEVSGYIGFIKRGDLGRDRDEQRSERFQVGQKLDAMVTGFDRSKKPNFSVKAFDDISNELRSQYSIGYTPVNAKHDGSFRKIEVRSKDGHRVQARKGYYSPIE